MPIWRYFVWVGGSLLALFIVADFYFPKHPARTDTPHSYNIPISAAKVAGPDALNFSGETRNFGPAPPMTVVDFSDPVQAARVQPPQAQANIQAQAQMTEAPTVAPPERRKIAKRKINRQRDVASVPETDPTQELWQNPWRQEQLRQDQGRQDQGRQYQGRREQARQEQWRQDQWNPWRRDRPTGLAYARPFTW